MPRTDHHPSGWRVRASSIISGQPASGSDGKTAQGSHTKVLHTPDTGQFEKMESLPGTYTYNCMGFSNIKGLGLG
jgi:hypothetical protein